MRVFIMLLLAVFLFLSCQEVNNTDENNNIDIVDIETYRTDALQLYYEEIINNPDHPNYNEPEFDQDEVNAVFDLIKAVYELDVPERDTVFSVYGIHTRYCNMTNALGLNVQTDAPEIQSLAAGVIPTGNSDLDSILATYAFDSVYALYSYPEFPWISLYTSESYNMIPVAEELATVNSILQTDLYLGCVGDGNTIAMERNEDFATLTFSIGWGDCPAGCIHHRYWEFRVIDGQAEFVQSFQD